MKIIVLSPVIALFFSAVSSNCFAHTLTITPTPSQTIGVQPYEANHFYYSDGMASYVKALDDELSQGGQYTNGQIYITPETGDLARVEELIVTLNITVTRSSGFGSGCVTILDPTHPFPRVIEHCDVSATVPIALKTNTIYNIQVNAAASHLAEILDEAHIQLPAEFHVPSLACLGFEAPMNSAAVKVRQSRALPLKAKLLDNEMSPVSELSAPPRLQVLYSSDSSAAVDVTSEALPAGQGTAGNQFEYSDGLWRFNLLTSNYTAAGTYAVSLVSGNEADYLIDPPCSVSFVIK